MTNNPVCWFELYVQDMKLAADNGGVVVKERSSIGPYGFIAHVMDTEDNLIGLHSLQ